jgi:hypothetical protein
MEPAADIANALCGEFSRTLGTGVVIAELQQGYDDTYVVVPSGGPDATDWNSGLQVENFQQYDIYCFNSKVKECYQMAYDAKRFFSNLFGMTQYISNPDYKLKAVKTVGGIIDLGKTGERKHMAKFTVQITYLAS